jgi:hypothetical protein
MDRSASRIPCLAGFVYMALLSEATEHGCHSIGRDPIPLGELLELRQATARPEGPVEGPLDHVTPELVDGRNEAYQTIRAP